MPLKAVRPWKIYQHVKFNGTRVDWCKFCTHLRSLNVHHSGTIDATGQ
jgi:hypothetical protein